MGGSLQALTTGQVGAMEAVVVVAGPAAEVVGKAAMRQARTCHSGGGTSSSGRASSCRQSIHQANGISQVEVAPSCSRVSRAVLACTLATEGHVQQGHRFYGRIYLSLATSPNSLACLMEQLLRPDNGLPAIYLTPLL